MRSTLSSQISPYLGVDLTDRYALGCRDIDVCGLTPADDTHLHSSFWHWQWDRTPHALDVEVIVKELRSARVAMLDGPQALAMKDSSMRVCERHSAAVGKTPDHRPGLTRPFAGFICSSLDLFEAFRTHELPVSPALITGGVFEVYPGHIWTILSGKQPLPRKGTEAGRIMRRRILETIGVTCLPEIPTHDQNDACVAAVLAAASDAQVIGINVVRVGAELSIDSDGVMREGPMMIPQLEPDLVDRIRRAISTSDSDSSKSIRVAQSPSSPQHEKADELLVRFLAQAQCGDPEVCTYAWAYRALIRSKFDKFSQAYARQVVNLASAMRPHELPGLGPVRLDAFIVSKKDHLPNHGHWETAQYDREDWERVLGSARLLE